MKTTVKRTIETVETVEMEVEFPKYTKEDDLFFYKHYSLDHSVCISVIGNVAGIRVTHSNKGRNLFDKEISEAEFNRVMAKASELLMPELQQKQEEMI